MHAIFTLTPVHMVPVAVSFEIRCTTRGPEASHKRRRGLVEASAAAAATAAAAEGSSRRSCCRAADAAAAHVAEVARMVLLLVVSCRAHAPPQVEIINRCISAVDVVAHRERVGGECPTCIAVRATRFR